MSHMMFEGRKRRVLYIVKKCYNDECTDKIEGRRRFFMENVQKRTDWSAFIIGVLLFAMAIIVFSNPVRNFFAVTWLIGLLAIFNGILEILFRRAKKAILGVSSVWTVIVGLVNIVFGILIMSNLAAGFMFLSYYFAAWFIVNAFFNLFTITPERHANKGLRFLTIVLDIIYILIGFVLLFNPLLAATTVSIMIGIAFLLSGLFYILDAFN